MATFTLQPFLLTYQHGSKYFSRLVACFVSSLFLFFCLVHDSTTGMLQPVHHALSMSLFRISYWIHVMTLRVKPALFGQVMQNAVHYMAVGNETKGEGPITVV